MIVTIKFTTATSAFHDDNIGTESARILRELADKVELTNFVSSYDKKHTLLDVNGNTVGVMVVQMPKGIATDILTRVDELYKLLHSKQPFTGLDADLTTALMEYLKAVTGSLTL